MEFDTIKNKKVNNVNKRKYRKMQSQNIKFVDQIYFIFFFTAVGLLDEANR